MKMLRIAAKIGLLVFILAGCATLTPEEAAKRHEEREYQRWEYYETEYIPDMAECRGFWTTRLWSASRVKRKDQIPTLFEMKNARCLRNMYDVGR